MACAEGDACKLAHEIALLVCHRGATVDGNCVFAVLCLNGAEALRNGVKDFVPTCTLQRAIFTISPHQWIGQAIWMIHRLISGTPFGTKHTVVQGKVCAWLYADDFAVCYFEIHTT